MLQRLHLEHGWTFRQADEPDVGFLPANSLPTEIHRDLWRHGLIPDPFVGKNEDQVQWVGEKAWIYQATFEVAPSQSAFQDLVFEGLDTFATVKLNDQVILTSKNAFVPYRIRIPRDSLQQENILEIQFESAFLKGQSLVEKDNKHFYGCWNGDPSRLAVRKPQYHYGWDWGPTLLTCGPWKPIYLESYDGRISDLSFTTHVDDSLASAEITARIEVEGLAEKIILDLTLDEDTISTAEIIWEPGTNVCEARFRTAKPKLWYPARYGQQPLYKLTATLKCQGETCHQVSKRFGIRKASVVQHKLKDSPGTSFMLQINNIPIFCGGSNWIPAHSFQTVLDYSRYREWLDLVVRGNQVMLRVWGGGIYEQDAFYDICDKLGILVWQDFMFACGNYPANNDFLESVKGEATANVKRLRNHPCIVLWAGNNEDYQYRETENLDYDPADKDPQNWLQTSFPARYIYEKVLPEVMQDLAPDTYYHFGSPYGGRTTTDATIGDIHQWNVWHGSQEKYQDFDELVGRFVSEFGMEAFPDIKTLESILPNGSTDLDRYAQSSTIEFHNKAVGHERRLALYLAENIRYDLEPLEKYMYSTQVIQAETISAAFRAWKRQWKGPGREYCAGAIVWQMNDCWPVISWSMVDHYLRPKLGYFALKREMEPLTIGMKRLSPSKSEDLHEIELWVCNLSLDKVIADITFSSTFFSTVQSKGKPYIKTIKSRHQDLEKRGISLPPNQSTEIMTFEIPIPHQAAVSTDDIVNQTVISATLRSSTDGALLARAINWPEPLKHVHLPRPGHIDLQLSRLPEDELTKERPKYRQRPQWWRIPNKVSTLRLRSDVPLKAVQVEVIEGDPDAVVFGDQGFDVTGDEPVLVRVWGLDVGEENRLSITYLGKDHTLDGC